MVCRLITGFNLASLCVFAAFVTGTVVSADPGKTYANTVAQDEQRVLPEDNAVFFAPNDRRIRLQLTKLGSSSASTFADTPLTVIDPAGGSVQLITDSRGMAILSNVSAGVYAVVSAGPSGHVAVPLILRELAEADQPVDADVVSNGRISTVYLPLVDIDATEAMRVANSFLPPRSEVAFSDLDQQLIASGQVVSTYRHRVRLEAGGRIEGQLVSLVRRELLEESLAGTNVLIYRGSQLVARAISDSQGRFAVENLSPGTHGLIAAGPGGYAAFGFDVLSGEMIDAVEEGSLISTTGKSENLVKMNQPMATGDVLPVPLVPQPMVPLVINAIRSELVPAEEGVLDPGVAGFAPVPGGGAAGGFGGGGGGLGGGAGGGIGGGGLLMLGAVGAAIAAAARDSRDRPIVFPPIATPAVPGPPVVLQGPPEAN